MLKYILLVICLLGCSQQGLKVNQKPQAGSIDEVASQFIHDLYQDKQVKVFRLDLPPKAVLPDHLTGPRAIVLLTDLTGQRLADGSSIEAKALQAFYLTNTFSAGFKNTSAQTASYLVISLTQQAAVNQQPTCPNATFDGLLEQGSVAVCQSQQSQSQIGLEATKTLVYSQQTSQVKPLSTQTKTELEVGDLMISLFQ
jgi:hypothetical protein